MIDSLNSITPRLNGDARGWHSVQKPTVEVDSLSFDHVLEAINPLNHIPVISEMTESSPETEPLKEVTQLAGSFLLGGPLGFAVTAINSVMKEATGTSLSEKLLDGVLDELV
jgi:hypothetical protein